jgi:hypothetical protein
MQSSGVEYYLLYNGHWDKLNFVTSHDMCRTIVYQKVLERGCLFAGHCGSSAGLNRPLIFIAHRNTLEAPTDRWAYSEI